MCRVLARVARPQHRGLDPHIPKGERTSFQGDHVTDVVDTLVGFTFGVG